MALILRKCVEIFNFYVIEKKDKRSDELFFGKSPIPLALVLSGYLLLIKYGPKLMESRKAFELKYILIVYNFIQVVLNTLLGVYGCYHVFLMNDFDFNCQPVDYSTTSKGFRELELTNYYFLLKLLDLLDTVIKLNWITLQPLFNISFSAIYCIKKEKHSLIIPSLLSSFLYGPWDEHRIEIHRSFMYFYYFMTAFKVELKKSIWWKKHITQIQLFQFALLFVHFLRGALASNCSYPKFWLWVLVIQNIFMFSMFADFYFKAYMKKKSKD
ncbi:CLUMA_CG018738, isoform A [Clunio marinus]|uniref:Elongation of very long chain fatty acids protein n=1 Tax=Clunio marinus TaxID=568069 RepID=A0A1J1IZK8_9DIPT|nr:CLUMA_CG018738, isoform A [Clunio marinus]